jgi:hypothetical protein
MPTLREPEQLDNVGRELERNSTLAIDVLTKLAASTTQTFRSDVVGTSSTKTLWRRTSRVRGGCHVNDRDD